LLTVFPGFPVFAGRGIIIRPGGGAPDHRLVPFLETLPSVIILFNLHFPFVFLMPFLEFGHCGGLIEKAQLHTAKKVFQVKDTLERQDLTNRISGLCAFMQPIQGPLTVQLDGGRNCKGIIGPQFLDELPVSGSAGVSYYDKVEGSLFRPMTLESDFDWHLK
jgi:hypothetical protein